MAQVTGGTTFDYVAKRKHEVAQKILARAADIWATNGRNSISLDSVIAILLHIFLSKWSQHGQLDQEIRTLEKWLSIVSTAREELNNFASQSPSQIEEMLSLLNCEISFAAEQWCLGNPEQPSTAHVLNTVEHILFTHKLTHRPANPKLPKMVCETKSN